MYIVVEHIKLFVLKMDFSDLVVGVPLIQYTSLIAFYMKG